MSLKCKGLLSVMLSLPDDWEYSIGGLCQICMDGETVVKSALKEMRKLGYLVVTKLMPNDTESGRIEYRYDIYEEPLQNSGKQEVGKQAVEKQGVEILPVEKQAVENPPQLNTYIPNTEESITEEDNISSENAKACVRKHNKLYLPICERLNEKAGTAYKPTSKATRKLIDARIKEGFTLEDFLIVIDKKCAEWRGTDMEKFLRPETLFGNKFEGYLNQTVGNRQKSSGRKSLPTEYHGIDPDEWLGGEE